MDASETCVTANRITTRSGQLGRVSLFLLLALFHLSLYHTTCGRRRHRTARSFPKDDVKGLTPTNAVNDTILPFEKPEFSYLQLHPMSFGPAIPWWKPSFYVYRFVLLFFSDTIHPRERQRTSTEIRFYNWTRSENGSKTRKRPLDAYPWRVSFTSSVRLS